MGYASLSGQDSHLQDRVLQGGYPESVSRSTPRRRHAWIRQYIDTLIARDVRDIASLDKLDRLPRLINVLAQVAGQLCNYSQLAGQVGMDHKTAGKYLSVFEQMYLLQRLPVWSNNRLSRLVKTPKMQFVDSGLLSTLLEVGEVSTPRHRAMFGRLLESFVFSELLKQNTWSERRYALFFYRDKDQNEIDFILENSAGEIIGIEVKASESLGKNDLVGLRRLAGLAPDEFKAGFILYDGQETLPLGAGIWAVPLSTLWNCSFRPA